MKQIIRNILLACVGMATLAACSNIDYDGEHTSDGMFEPNNQAYFYFAQPEDTVLNYSFGVKTADTLTHVVYVPVQLAGNLVDTKQTFSVKVAHGTTAVAGTHYTLNADTLNFAPKAYRAYVPVTLIRANLSEDRNDSIQLVLNLVGSDALGIRFTTNNKVKITFNNVLSKPDFWIVMETYWGLGAFTKNKYRKLLAYYDGNESTIGNILNGTDGTAQGYLYQHVQEVVAYFAAHPNEL